MPSTALLGLSLFLAGGAAAVPSDLFEFERRVLQTKDCKAVPLRECGTKIGVDTCLRCAPGGGYDCEVCCPGLKRTSIGGYTFCEPGKGPPPPGPGGTYLCYNDQCYAGKGTQSKAQCDASCGAPSPPPGPGAGYTCYQGVCYPGKGGKQSKAQCDASCGGPPGPPPGGDSWDTYTVAGMEVQSVTGGSDRSAYEKVVIMLHGGGETGAMWPNYYSMGWFGTQGSGLNGLKYVFPTSPDHLWYQDYKNPACGLLSDCAYNISSIRYKASLVRALIDHEMSLPAIKNNGKKVFLAGFSEGAQMTGYMQLVNLPFALGGVSVFDGFPLPPLENMPGAPTAAARANASYYGQDMRWMIWHGSADPIFPVTLTINTWKGIFEALGCSSTMTTHVIPGMTHTLQQQEFTQFIAFVRNGTTVSS